MAASYPRPPVPPPPPRRYSDPTSRSHTDKQQHRRHSDTKHTHVDLRQELVSLNLNNREVDTWLGKFDEKDETVEDMDFRFNHDIPLQRSISLDRGLDIVSYLQALGSDWSESEDSSVSSIWSLASNGQNSELRLEQYRSFEDIPAPPKTKNRHVSLDVSNSPFGNSLALSVLRESYKGINIEMGSDNISPQVKKLQKTFSFKNFEDYRDSTKSSIENLDANEDEDEEGLRMLSNKNIAVERDEYINENKSVRQRRLGVTTNEWQQKSTNDLRKLVLIQQNLLHVKSCDDIFTKNKGELSRRNSTETLEVPAFIPLKDSYKNENNSKPDISNLPKLKVIFSSLTHLRGRHNLPTIVVEDISRLKNMCIENTGTNISSYTSSLIEIDSYCNCRICCENDNDKKPFLGNNINRLFYKIVSYMNCARKFACWDENNNLSESEMYRCIMHLLRLLFGLWLRHLDHNSNN